MRCFTLLLAVLCLTASAVWAGPNAGGTLVVHDTGLTYSSDMTVPPVSPLPIDCAAIDNNAPAGSPIVWKVYAAFPTGSSPRLKALAWGITLTSQVEVSDAGMPDPVHDFEIGQGGWPNTNGASIGLSFGFVHTDLVSECYWFGGYGTSGEAFGTAPHAIGTSVFVDDSVPSQEDLIAGFSSMGFGQDGLTICSWLYSACCFPDGGCQVLLMADCAPAGGVPQGPGSDCDPNPCTAFGACCDLGFGTCVFTTQANCGAQGLVYLGDGIPCTPNPCPVPPTGACCYFNGNCVVVNASTCAQGGGAYQGDGATCEPNPCPQPGTGACCNYSTGFCWITTQYECAYYGDAYLGDGTDCDPDPCPQSGACCFSSGQCIEYIEAQCDDGNGLFLGEGTVCSPNPCPPGGACCFPDGHCMLFMEFICIAQNGTYQGAGTSCVPNPCPPPLGACCRPDGTCVETIALDCSGLWMMFVVCVPNPCAQTPTGACCFPDGTCQVLAESVCVQGQGLYQGDGVPCTPTLCPVPNPTERSSWGRIKARYH